MTAPARNEELPDVGRLLSLSDGVVAVALTLLVVSLHVPELSAAREHSASALARGLAHGAPQLTSYLISFYVVAQFWLAHYEVFRRIGGQREGLAWWNFAFLLTITLMPFTSDLLGRYSQNPLAIDIFAANLLAASLATRVTMFYGRRKHLVVRESAARDIRAERLRSAGIVLVICLSIGVAWVSTSAAQYCWLLLIVVPRAARPLADAPWVAAHLRPRD
ncbi:MAG: TMEM175 family protein [Streptosporangiaceae bacterium]